MDADVIGKVLAEFLQLFFDGFFQVIACIDIFARNDYIHISTSLLTSGNYGWLLQL